MFIEYPSTYFNADTFDYTVLNLNQMSKSFTKLTYTIVLTINSIILNLFKFINYGILFYEVI